jgi:hypothetical protein
MVSRRTLCLDGRSHRRRVVRAERVDAHLERVATCVVHDHDTKTSSWVITHSDIRKLGGAIFCDRRYRHVFTYHNGAESYYAARGFRGSVKV